MKPLKNAVLLFSFFCLPGMVSYAQAPSGDTAKKTILHNHGSLPNPQPVFPQFPGGRDSLAAFIKRNTRYPAAAREKHISGIVEVYFKVAKDGTIENPVVRKPFGYGCDEEAIRVVHLMPKWIPATKGREPMALEYHVAIPFGKTRNK